MIRFVFGFDNRHHVGPGELHSLSWLSLRDRINYFKLIHLFKIKHGLGPRYLRKGIVSVSETHLHRTRGSVSDFHVSKSLSNCPSAFAFTCVKQWNSLPSRIKAIDSFPSFKRELKQFYLSSYGWWLFVLRTDIHGHWTRLRPLYLLCYFVESISFTWTLLETSLRTFTGYPWFFIVTILHCISRESK